MGEVLDLKVDQGSTMPMDNWISLSEFEDIYYTHW